MKKLLLLIMLICAGCAQVTRVEVPDIGKSTSVGVRDERPATEKEREFFSLMITSDAYGISRVGDATIEPSPVRLLQHRAYEKLGSSPQALNLTVHHFVTYFNMASSGKRGAFGAILGPIGAAVATGTANTNGSMNTINVDRPLFDSLFRDEFKRGLFSAAENPNGVSSFIVFIDADINGKRIFTRTLYPIVPNDDSPLAKATDAAIQGHLAAY